MRYSFNTIKDLLFDSLTFFEISAKNTELFPIESLRKLFLLILTFCQFRKVDLPNALNRNIILWCPRLYLFQI
jgi:hypothetical protein